MEFKSVYIETPLGIAKISGDHEGIAEISVLDDEHTTPTPINDMPNYLKLAAIQLKEYFNGTRTSFDLKLQPQGTPFQKKVWNALLDIPYGRTRTYTEQTKHLGDIKAIRAVAYANGKNPLWIVVPCHRVVGSDGSLTGYAGGIWRKKWLLEHESGSKQQSLF